MNKFGYASPELSQEFRKERGITSHSDVRLFTGSEFFSHILLAILDDSGSTTQHITESGQIIPFPS